MREECLNGSGWMGQGGQWGCPPVSPEVFAAPIGGRGKLRSHVPSFFRDFWRVDRVKDPPPLSPPFGPLVPRWREGGGGTGAGGALRYAFVSLPLISELSLLPLQEFEAVEPPRGVCSGAPKRTSDVLRMPLSEPPPPPRPPLSLLAQQVWLRRVGQRCPMHSLCDARRALVCKSCRGQRGVRQCCTPHTELSCCGGRGCAIAQALRDGRCVPPPPPGGVMMRRWPCRGLALARRPRGAMGA